MTGQETNSSGNRDSEGTRNLLERCKVYVVPAVLIAYLVLLAIGTLAEIFKIQSILDWWIWSPPGK